MKQYSRSKSMGDDFAERFNRTIRYFLKRSVFEKSDSNWIDILLTITKHYSERIHSSSKLTPIQGSFEKNEGYVHQNLLDKRKKTKPNYKIHDLVRVAVLRKIFSKGELVLSVIRNYRK